MKTKRYNLINMMYHGVAWILILPLIFVKESMLDKKIHQPLGWALNLWLEYGIVLEFIPLLVHLHFIWTTMKKKRQTEQSKDLVVTDVVFDSLRELIVEYLIKGINLAMLKSKQEVDRHIPTQSAKRRNEAPIKHKLDATELQRACIEEELHCFAFQRTEEEEKLGFQEFLPRYMNIRAIVLLAFISPYVFSHCVLKLKLRFSAFILDSPLFHRLLN